MDIIDQHQLTALYGHKETALDIIHMFVDQAPQLLEEVEKAMNDEDTSILAKICHKGVGQARYIASPLIEETLIDLQKAPESDKLEHFKKLQTYIQKLTDEYA
jgi:HPt (histidine-containing phosphotransfer) domain-containing protein